MSDYIAIIKAYNIDREEETVIFRLLNEIQFQEFKSDPKQNYFYDGVNLPTVVNIYEIKSENLAFTIDYETDRNRKYKEYLKRMLEHNPMVYVALVKEGTNPRWDRGIPRKFNVWFWNPDKGELEKIFFDSDMKDVPDTWVPRKLTKSGRWKGGYFETNVLGSDRIFEIVRSISYWLFGDNYKLKWKYLS